MGFIHQLSDKQLAELSKIKKWKYEPKQRFFDSLSARVLVDSNMILAKMKEQGIDISNPIEVMNNIHIQKDYNNNDSIDYIKLNQYLKLRKELWHKEYFEETLSLSMQELFNKFFKISGDGFIKEITLR